MNRKYILFGLSCLFILLFIVNCDSKSKSQTEDDKLIDLAGDEEKIYYNKEKELKFSDIKPATEVYKEVMSKKLNANNPNQDLAVNNLHYCKCTAYEYGYYIAGELLKDNKFVGNGIWVITMGPDDNYNMFINPISVNKIAKDYTPFQHADKPSGFMTVVVKDDRPGVILINKFMEKNINKG